MGNDLSGYKVVVLSSTLLGHVHRRSSSGKCWRRLNRLSFLMLFAALSQQFLHQPVVAGETSPSDKTQTWFGGVWRYNKNPHSSGSPGVGSAESLNWIRLERLGNKGIDPDNTEDGERMRMGWDKINFQKNGLQLQNVSGLSWADELLKNGIADRKYSIPWAVPDKKTNDNYYNRCSAPNQGSHCIDALFQLNSSGNKLNSNNPWFFARANGNGNTSRGAVNSTTTIPLDWSRLATWGDYEGWRRANRTITVKSIRQNGSSNWWNGRFEFSGFQNPFCFKNSSGEGSSKSVSSGGGCVINSSSNNAKILTLNSNAWVDAHKLGTGAYNITLNSGSVFDLHGKNLNFSALSGSGSLRDFGLLSKTASGTATYSGNLTGSGRLVINAGGTQTLSGSNTYSGSTTVSKGTLKAGKKNAFSASSDTIVEKGATLDLGGTTQTINKLFVKGWDSKVKNGTLVNRDLTNEGQITFTGLSQSQGSITNSGDINLGSGSLKATRLTTSGRLNIQGSAELEKLVNSGGEAIFEDLSVKTASRSNQSIENAAILTIQGALETSAPVLARGRSTTTIIGVAGQTSADIRGLLVGQESNQSGSSSFTLRNGNLDSDFIRIGSEKSSSPSSVTLNNGDVFSHSITIQSGSSLDVGGTIDLFEQDHANGGSFELHGMAEAEVLQGSNGDDQVNLDAGSDLTLSGSTSTNLGQCSGVGCNAAINLGPGNDLLVTNQATVSIPSGSVIDGGDLGTIVNGEWVGEINVYENESPGQFPGFEKTDLRNFALINYDGDWETPSGLKGCNFDGDGNFSVAEDRTCLLLQSESPKGNTLKINQGATLRAGVISFDVDGDVSSAQDNVIRLENGNLSAVVVEGRSDINDQFLLGSDQGDSGTFSVQLISGFDRLKQQGGTWTYDLKGYDFGDVPLELQVQSGDVIIDSSADASGAGTGEATFSSITIMGTNGSKQTQITNKGELTVTGEKGSGITGNASLLTTSGSTTRLGGSSNYTGSTKVEEGASLIALNDLAFSTKSEHSILGFLELGEGEWSQHVKKLNLEGGVISEGTLSTKEGLFSSGGEIYANLSNNLSDSSGSGGLIITGGETVLYGIDSDYSGDTIVQSGILKAGQDGVLSPASDITIGDAGTLNLNGTSQILTNVNLDLDGGLIDGEEGYLNAFSVTSTGGQIRGLNSGELTRLNLQGGTTILDVDGERVDIGTITVANGTLQAGRANAFSASSDTTVQSGGVLDLGDASQTIHTLTTTKGSTVQKGSLVTRNLTNAGQINLKGLSQSEGSIENTGGINLGSGSLTATRVTNSGRLNIQGATQLEKLETSGNATFQDLSVESASRSNLSIENSGHLMISGSLETSASVLLRGTSTSTIKGVEGKTSADVLALFVGTKAEQSDSSSFSLGNGNLDADIIRIGSKTSSSPSSVALNNGDLFSHSITIQSGSSLDVGGTIDLFDQDNPNGGSLNLHGTAKAEVLQGSDGDDQVNLDVGADLNLIDSIATNLGECSGGDGCNAAINLGLGDDLLIMNEATLSIPPGSDIDGGDIGQFNGREWVGEMNVYQNLTPDQSPGFERSALRNFAVIKYGDDWETSQGLQGCNFDRDGKFSVTSDKTCLLLDSAGLQSNNLHGNTLTISNGATFRAGVISFASVGSAAGIQASCEVGESLLLGKCIKPGQLLPDQDGDGLADLIDFNPSQPCIGDQCLVGNKLPDQDEDGIPDVIDPNPTRPCEGDDCDVAILLPDSDGDNLPDLVDPDDNNDGVADSGSVGTADIPALAFQEEGSDDEPEPSLTPMLVNGELIQAGQKLPDTDGDKIPDLVDPEPDVPCLADECLVGDKLPDQDGDGIPDVIDDKPNAPCVADECLVGTLLPDADDDGLPDILDPDEDNDGVADFLATDNIVELKNGNLFAVVIEGSPNVYDNLVLGTSGGGSGALGVQSLTGFNGLIQKGGTWTYDIKSYGFGGSNLALTVQSGDVIIDSAASASGSGTGQAVFSSIVVNRADRAEPSVITNKGELTVTGETGLGITGNASLLTKSGSTTRLGGSSNYTGETVVEEGASLIALNDFALSDASEHTIRGNLELGEVEGHQQVKKLNLEGGVISEGILSTKESLFSSGGEIYANLTGSSSLGGLITTGGLTTLHSAGSDYSGETTVKVGILRAGADGVFSSNSKTTTIADQGVLDLNGTNQNLLDVHLKGGLLNGNYGTLNAKGIVSWGGTVKDLGGLFRGAGGGEFGSFEVREGVTIFSGKNNFRGTLDVVGGEVRAANDFSFSPSIKTTASGNGVLNFLGHQQRIDDVEVFEGGRMYVDEGNPFEADYIKLRAGSTQSSNPGGIVVSLQKGATPSIQVNKEFIFENGSLVVTAPSSDEPEGEYKIILGSVRNADDLARNTFLVTTGVGRDGFRFTGLDEEHAVMGPAVYKGYLTEGSLNLVIAPKTQEELFCGLHPGDPDCDGLDLNYPSPDLSGSFCPVGESFVDGECLSAGNDEPDLIGNQLPDLIGNELPDLIGNDQPDLIGNDLPDLIGIELPDVGELPDKDGDGLPDVIDEKPEKPCEGEACSPPDIDGDGLSDSLDPEPEIPSVGNELPNVGELPDKDGDGLPDVIDEKPEVPCEGEACSPPDRDGDGLPDALDPEPDVGNKLPNVGELPDEDGDGLPDVIDPKPETPCEGNECLIDLPDTDGDKIPDVIDNDDDNDGIPDEKDPDADGDGQLDQLPGCAVGDDLCDIISDIPGDEDDALQEEENLASDVIEGLLDGLAQEEIDLPLSFDYGQLARLITSGLLPRNVDAPGRSLFNYNNLLVDTVFERLPLRQFAPVEVSAVVEEEALMEEPAPVTEPVRGLWSQQLGMQDEQAEAFVGQQFAQAEQLVEVSSEMEIDGVGYVEDPLLTAQYANREGVRAWYRAFGGDLGPTTTSTLYGDYNASASGMVLGADVSIGSNVQIGAFANYGDVSLYQFSGETGSGAWSPSGWGGGVTADWRSDNVYVQGLISASSFSGTQSRNIIPINGRLGNQTAQGEKSVTSYAYALRLGAPFQTGSLLLEPQFTAAWTQNQESGFKENGADQLNLRYGSRTTNFLQTELGMKLALPIRSGERGEWVPNLRVAWLGDWNMNNEDQSIGYSFTDKTVGVSPLEDDQNGVLIEAGLDYTMANINSGSWKLYVRAGAEVWGGERGTDWRASGGMTWQF